jgi:F-box protein 11
MSIEWGQNWRDRIEKSINSTSFLIPVMTPSFFKSDFCRNELQQFIQREERLTRSGLILPLYYISSPVLEDEAKWVNDKLAETLASRQYADWRELRFKSFTSFQARKSLEKFALQIRNTLEHIENSSDVAPSREFSLPDTFFLLNEDMKSHGNT